MALEEKDIQTLEDMFLRFKGEMMSEIEIIMDEKLNKRFEEFELRFESKMDLKLRKAVGFMCDYMDEILGDLSPRVKSHENRIVNLELDNAMIKRHYLKL